MLNEFCFLGVRSARNSDSACGCVSASLFVGGAGLFSAVYVLKSLNKSPAAAAAAVVAVVAVRLLCATSKFIIIIIYCYTISLRAVCTRCVLCRVADIQVGMQCFRLVSCHSQTHIGVMSKNSSIYYRLEQFW